MYPATVSYTVCYLWQQFFCDISLVKESCLIVSGDVIIFHTKPIFPLDILYKREDNYKLINREESRVFGLWQ